MFNYHKYKKKNAGFYANIILKPNYAIMLFRALQRPKLNTGGELMNLKTSNFEITISGNFIWTVYAIVQILAQ